MKINILKNAEELGKVAAKHGAEVINKAIAERGKARIVLSTGASQTETLKYILQEKIEWDKVEVFHLDEYIGLPFNHAASFRKYLQERFLDFVNVKKFNFVNVEGDIESNIADLTAEIRSEQIDLGYIGIGENAHIAFNDPPANFQTEVAYMVVNLDDACKKQQVGEGCFPTLADVPNQAISMSVHQIMQCRTIISCVPDKRKASAVKMTITSELSNETPATMLKKHPDFHLYLDEAAASELK
jgi:glucosamine-6-phosphate deaminase